ncbi:hypothetical protein V8E53_001686 [Lactarius tabidus]
MPRFTSPVHVSFFVYFPHAVRLQHDPDPQTSPNPPDPSTSASSNPILVQQYTSYKFAAVSTFAHDAIRALTSSPIVSSLDDSYQWLTSAPDFVADVEDADTPKPGVEDLETLSENLAIRRHSNPIPPVPLTQTWPLLVLPSVRKITLGTLHIASINTSPLSESLRYARVYVRISEKYVEETLPLTHYGLMMRKLHRLYPRLTVDELTLHSVVVPFLPGYVCIPFWLEISREGAYSGRSCAAKTVWNPKPEGLVKVKDGWIDRTVEIAIRQVVSLTMWGFGRSEPQKGTLAHTTAKSLGCTPKDDGEGFSEPLTVLR